MEISELTLKLIIILIPGIITVVLYEKLTVHQRPLTPFRVIINSILFGLFSYLLLQTIEYSNARLCAIINDIEFEGFSLEVWQTINDKNIIPYGEVFWASIIGFFLGTLFVFLDQKRVVHRITQKFNISQKYGDENLYTHFLKDANTIDVYLRDIENKLTYHGVVAAYSETDAISEIVLNDVTVYSYEDSNELYSVESLYLAKSKDKFIIETPLK